MVCQSPKVIFLQKSLPEPDMDEGNLSDDSLEEECINMKNKWLNVEGTHKKRAVILSTEGKTRFENDVIHFDQPLPFEGRANTLEESKDIRYLSNSKTKNFNI